MDTHHAIFKVRLDINNSLIHIIDIGDKPEPSIIADAEYVVMSVLKSLHDETLFSSMIDTKKISLIGIDRLGNKFTFKHDGAFFIEILEHAN
jgi:hypothetical protein